MRNSKSVIFFFLLLKLEVLNSFCSLGEAVLNCSLFLLLSLVLMQPLPFCADAGKIRAERSA